MDTNRVEEAYHTMSLTGRYIIDRIKRRVGKYVRLPAPPQGDIMYWQQVYKGFGPEESFEWGVSYDDLKEYKYKDVQWDKILGGPVDAAKGDDDDILDGTLGNALGVQPFADKDEPIMMLGCGNSKLGEDMITDGGWRGPMIQVDVAGHIIDAMSHRCAPLIKNGHMNFVEDDATELSAFNTGMFNACIDKGLIDALFCADEYKQCESVLSSVHRVLKPGGSFVFLSFSRPEFILKKMLLNRNDGTFTSTRKRPEWESIDIQGLNKIMLYRFQKSMKVENKSGRIKARWR